MRAALAVPIALLLCGPVCAEPAPPASPFVDAPHPVQVAQVSGRAQPASPQRANVPRTSGTGLTGIPGGAKVLGMSPGAAAAVGVAIAIGVIAVVASDDDDDAPAGTGSGSN